MINSSDRCCPLCNKPTVPFHSDKKRQYFLCEHCFLVHVPPEFHLSSLQEKAEYDKHENAFGDEGYERFLSRMLLPILEITTPNSQGLDFGCGPAPVLAEMFRRNQREVSVYDKYYFAQNDVLARQYDFIVATEVVEHIWPLKDTLELLLSRLKTKGVLGIMTKRWLSLDRFANWHYKNDPTHLCFFHEKTFHYLAQLWSKDAQIVSADVVIFS